MNNNGRNSIYYKDNSFHIKVNRNSNPYSSKMNQILSNNNIQINDLSSSITFTDKRITKLKREELLLRKINKNKNIFQSLNNSNNISSLLNKQNLNKITEKTFQKYKSERGIIDTLNSLRNKHKKLNYSNKINKSNSIYQNLNNNINYNNKSINDYRTKINNIKNKIQNTLSKASSFNNEFKNSIKNYNSMNYNACSSNDRKMNNIFIEDTSNDTDILTESEKINNNNNNNETNLYVYRSEVQYPMKNIFTDISIPYSTSNENNYNKYNYKTLNNVVNEGNSNNNNLPDSNANLVENISKSVANSRTKRVDYHKCMSNSNSNNMFSPLKSRILINNKKNIKNLNNRKILNTSNNSLKIRNKIYYLKSRVSPISLNLHRERNNKKNNTKKGLSNYIERNTNNNNAKSCHQFYRKKCFSKDRYDKHIEKDFYDDDSSNKEKTISTQSIQNKNNIFLNNMKNNINSYNHYNKKYKKRNYQFNSISKFCESIEKFLIFVLKYYYEYFINQLNKYIESKNNNKYKKHHYYDNDKNMHYLLIKRLKNKINSKKLQHLENYNVNINLSNYKKHAFDNKLNYFELLSRNENKEQKIYKKKSNSINKSLNSLITKTKEKNFYSAIKKKKNLSHNKIYIPKRKNPQINKYKTLKINTKSFINEINININNEDIMDDNNLISTTINNNLQTQDNIKNKFFRMINGNDEIIKNINHLTALRRKYNNKKNKGLSINTNNYSSNILTDENDIIKPNKTEYLINNNIYSKPVFKNLKKKIMKNEKNSENFNYSSAQKDKQEKKIKELIIYKDNNNENKKINSENKIPVPKNNLLTKKILTRKKASYSNNKIKNINNKNNDKDKNNNGINEIQKENNTVTQDNNKEKSNKEENEVENNDCTILRSIIVKDVSSKDKLLNVFIKYYECNFPKLNRENKIKHDYNIISNEPISIISTIKINNYKKEKNNNRYLHQILSSIIEEDEKSKANPSVNNSNSEISEEESEKNNTNANNNTDNIPKINNKMFTNNIVRYLTNILQNLYDDNKKMILYMFMRNLKKIQNQLYLKNSLIQFSSFNRNEINKNTYTENSSNEHKIIASNGADKLELNNTNNGGEENHSSKNIFFYTADNCLLDEKMNNKKNILIGSLLFKDFEINEEEYEYIKPKKSLSSSSINEVKHNGSETNIFKNKNILKNIIIEIDNKIIKKYFLFWKKYIKDYKRENYNIDNGMNIIERNNEINNFFQRDKIIYEDKNINKLKIDNGKEIKNESNVNDFDKEQFLSNKEEYVQRINNFRNSLIKFSLKK